MNVRREPRRSRAADRSAALDCYCAVTAVVANAALAHRSRIVHYRRLLNSDGTVSNQDERPRPSETAARITRSAAEQKESQRLRAFEAVEATFPSPSAATSDELVQMAIHALGFDAASVAASLGIARAEGEAMMRNPGTISLRHRALLAQYLEMRGDARTAERNRAIAARLRERSTKDARPDAEKPVGQSPGA